MAGSVETPRFYLKAIRFATFLSTLSARYQILTAVGSGLPADYSSVAAIQYVWKQGMSQTLLM